MYSWVIHLANTVEVDMGQLWYKSFYFDMSDLCGIAADVGIWDDKSTTPVSGSLVVCIWLAGELTNVWLLDVNDGMVKDKMFMRLRSHPTGTEII